MLDFKNIFSALPGATPTLASIFGLRLPTLIVTGLVTLAGGSFSVAPTAPNFVGAMAVLVDGAAVAVNAALAQTFTITCASNAAREISVPLNGVAGMRIVVRIINTSGGALTLTTFAAAIKQPALTYPATATTKEFQLFFDGTEWELTGYSPANIPN